MFTVGKKYTYKFNTFECIATHLFRKGQVAGVMRYVGTLDDPEDHGDIPSVRSWSDDWKEYHDPVSYKFTRHVTTSDDNRDLEIWRDLKNASLDYEDTHVGSVEFVVTDGKLTDVRIL